MHMLKASQNAVHFASRHILTLLIVAFVGLLIAGNLRRTFETSAVTGSVIKGFRATSYEGGVIGEEFLRGKVVVVKFFTTWCSVCKAEQPGYNYEYQRYKNRNVLFVGIPLNDPVGKVKAYIKTWHIPYTVVVFNESILNIFGRISSVPTTFIVNRNGEIVSELRGFTSPIRLEYEISRLIR